MRWHHMVMDGRCRVCSSSACSAQASVAEFFLSLLGWEMDLKRSKAGVKYVFLRMLSRDMDTCVKW